MNFSKLIFQIRSSTRIPLKSPHTHSVSHFLAKMNSQDFIDCSLQIKLMANTFNGKYPLWNSTSGGASGGRQETAWQKVGRMIGWFKIGRKSDQCNSQKGILWHWSMELRSSRNKGNQECKMRQPGHGMAWLHFTPSSLSSLLCSC